MIKQKTFVTNVITWKDADQNFCSLATRVLLSARGLAYVEDMPKSHPTTNPSFYPHIPPGFNDKDGSASSIFSIPYVEIRRASGESISSLENQNHESKGYFGSAQCSYCFLNMIRLRIIEARQELLNNCYKRSKKAKSSSQASRNDFKRGQTKFQRLPDRDRGPE